MPPRPHLLALTLVLQGCMWRTALAGRQQLGLARYEHYSCLIYATQAAPPGADPRAPRLHVAYRARGQAAAPRLGPVQLSAHARAGASSGSAILVRAPQRLAAWNSGALRCRVCMGRTIYIYIYIYWLTTVLEALYWHVHRGELRPGNRVRCAVGCHLHDIDTSNNVWCTANKKGVGGGSYIVQ